MLSRWCVYFADVVVEEFCFCEVCVRFVEIL